MSGTLSFEFFPPKTPAMEESLWRSIQRLAPLKPDFVSVTYGAGGSTRERTHSTLQRLLAETQLVPAAHLTCVNANRDEVDEVAQAYWDAGVRHIVALRGDAPADAAGNFTRYLPHPEGYAFAVDLVAGLKRIGDFEVSVAGYPERHPESADLSDDLDNLKRKVDAGATRVITQFFFEAETFCRFVENARKAGITVPIVPGILPVTNFAQVQKFAKACGAAVPDWMGGLFEGLDGDPETRQLVSASVAVKLCEKLRDNGVEDFHFYTLNRADLTLAICRMLGLGARVPASVA
ncbi:methylenetetrahydrofolate reductase [NAD(P)H] [Oceanibaculum pacificum]|uniref:Methylenetetrahydrofolate reductase n=1 Tax=Oceanibaculum pacificum TaxID=580166 RepID=A0A154WFV9_9PROT|nr:methylenetetrahydrofolate reductase [NAD(P)H] [Oceanibaculum pacificum]KZD12345.1 5,10-methylenetetrahydrofolate reductase [Oceanibaculum pacificum]